MLFGRFYNLSVSSKLLPFVSAVLLGSFVLIDGSLGQVMQISGTVTSVLSAVAATTLLILDFKKWKKTEQGN